MAAQVLCGQAMSAPHPYDAGRCRRWHSNPALAHINDRLDGHHGRCGLLVMLLWPDHSHDLLQAAITHDLGECVTGDLSATFKRARPDIAKAAYCLETDYLHKWGLLFILSEQDAARLKLVDRLDAYLTAKHHAPHEMAGDGWPDARRWLYQEQERLVEADRRIEL